MISIAVICIALAAAAVLLAVRGPSATPSDRSWSPAVDIPVPGSAVGSAQVAVEAGGGIHVLFTQRIDGAWALRQISRPAGGDWSEAQTLVASSAFPIQPTGLATNQRGDLAALWLLTGGRRAILMSSTRPAGGEWQAEQAISRVAASPWGRVVVADDGTATVIGRGLNGPGLWTVRHPPGGPWTPPRRITTEGLGIDAPAVAVADDGRVGVVALAKIPGRVRSLVSMVATSTGEWDAPLALVGTEGARSPVAMFAADGTLVAGWTTERDRRATIETATLPPSGVWTRPRIHDRVPAASAGSLALAGRGVPMLTWVRWVGAPADGKVEVRAADPIATGERPVRVAAPAVSTANTGGGPPPSTYAGPPPVLLVAGAGDGGLLAIGSAVPEGLAVSVAAATDGAWGRPTVVTDPPRPGYLIAAAGGDSDSAVVVWAAGAPLTAPDRLLFSER
ncbi:hypothetical protein [Miltoncostaea oceani]|uniref:hypothetical protein n=1 Tax=Miltoncostaea oceani TaxID=2843216 RepID=UPI001C3C893D|nr:hypothetical protein [Miltoncostaea oceani]